MTGFVLLALIPVLVGVVVGYALGGRLSALAGRFRALWLLWLAAAVQASQYYAAGPRALIEDRLGIPMLGIVFGLVAAWLAVNVGGWPPMMRAAAGVVIAGAALNASVIAANGRMPYAPPAAAEVGLPAAATTAKNEPADADTRLAFLGDVMAVPVLNKVISVGDVLIGVGTAVLVAAAMRRETSTPEPSTTIHHDGGTP
ncbi:MAG: hypothetical protein GEV03_08060 [Streptosporangiales bacterium]|nr:hypothetical protein [Streptosporangiales bacterium]